VAHISSLPTNTPVLSSATAHCLAVSARSPARPPSPLYPCPCLYLALHYCLSNCSMDSNQLTQVESLCHALYLGTSPEARAEAQQQLLTLQSSAEFIPQCQYILDNSTQPYAQLLASNSLEALITLFWNNFNTEQKLELRNYILNYLAMNGPSSPQVCRPLLSLAPLLMALWLFAPPSLPLRSNSNSNNLCKTMSSAVSPNSSVASPSSVGSTRPSTETSSPRSASSSRAPSTTTSSA
jgi:hypothetical protein